MKNHTPEQVARFRKIFDKAAESKKTPELEWESDWDAHLDADEMAAILHDTLKDEDPKGGGWQDHGIGAYEYQGARGVDVRIAYTIEDACCVVRVKGIGYVPPLASKTAMSYSGGGCDGDHGGRCGGSCGEWEAEIEWTAEYQELRGTDLYIWFEGEQL